MTAKTHVSGGIISGLVIIAASLRGDFGVAPMGALELCGTLAACIFGSLAPDVDLRNSRAGSSVKPLSATINAMFGHRTICHSPFLWGALYYLICHHYPAAQPLALALFIGALSHIALDMLNRAGVPLLWPVPTRFWICGIRLDGIGEKTIRCTLCCLSVFTVINLTLLLLNGK